MPNVINAIANANASNAEARLSSVVCASCSNRISYEDGSILLYNGNVICNDCMSDMPYEPCDNCGRFIPETDFYNGHILVDNDGMPVAIQCPNCAESTGCVVVDNTHIHNYGYKPTAIFHGEPLKSSKGDVRMYFGIEYEIDTTGSCFTYDNRNALSNELYELSSNEDFFYQKTDGSLNGACEHSGIENVFHPMTIDFINSSSIIEDVCSIANKYKYLNQRGTAGLHIHVSRAAFGKNEGYQIWNISKMVYCFDKFWDSLLVLANRTNTHYCFKPNIEVAKMTNSEYEQAVMEKCNNHYCSVNNQNKNTVEFRIFNSTTEAWRIKAYVQLIRTMFRFVESRNFKQLANVTLEQVLESDYPELNRLMSEYTSRNN